jgi:Flp pilus assembly protein protease CpaA
VLITFCEIFCGISVRIGVNALKTFWTDHPVLSNWLVLAVGFVVILYFSAQHVGFTPPQWAALIAATVVLAGLCAWIINWE